MNKLNILRKLNKLIGATQNERIATEKLVRSREIYNSLTIPESCFKTKTQNREVALY